MSNAAAAFAYREVIENIDDANFEGDTPAKFLNDQTGHTPLISTIYIKREDPFSFNIGSSSPHAVYHEYGTGLFENFGSMDPDAPAKSGASVIRPVTQEKMVFAVMDDDYRVKFISTEETKGIRPTAMFRKAIRATGVFFELESKRLGKR
jgi:hypothetical protein